MKYTLAIVLFLIKFCVSNELKCGLCDGNVESVEFYCENYAEPLPYNCTTSFLQWIHTCDKSKVTELKISGCDHETVAQIAGDFKNVRSLHIPYSGYESLDTLELKLDRLVTLNASHNQLTKMSKEFFNHTPNVAEVDLSYNKFGESGYVDLPDVKTLHLSHNKITSRYLNYIKANKLEYLDLDNNSIDELTTSFYFLKNLKTLRLENNEIHGLDTVWLLRNEIAIHVSWKYVTKFHFFYLRGQIRAVVSNQNEGVFHKPDGSVELRCREMGFENLKLFRSVDVKFENVADVIRCFTPSLERLRIAGNELMSEFNFMWLENQKHLKLLRIDLNSNIKLKNISYLKNFTKLNNLDLSYNQLENVTELIQHLNPSIKTLYLDRNYYDELNDATFQKLVNLKELRMRSSNLSLVNVSPFKALTKLETLDVRDNTIKTLNLTSMPGENLEKLFLSRNDLKELDNLTPTRFPKLSLLDIGANQFPCEYLRVFVPKVRHEFKNIDLGYAPWIQKFEDCTPEN
ncbi:toll-like receptor 13 [Contarinia nasturtii]|uniref:toll-like receptor 13 n=1 Tax=Contarinia nasturtii TaxID=265458 RepID=UPI0012D3FA70|nr:toll-like receptor 13 [Contarinia nasturtii]XP_031623746.1 toll-like receptor 13 [Contarinia nasturtii]